MQSIYPDQYDQLFRECSQIAEVLHRNIPRGINITEDVGATGSATL
jgi:3-deoxy-7-phosphoheptulonate synthase